MLFDFRRFLNNSLLLVRLIVMWQLLFPTSAAPPKLVKPLELIEPLESESLTCDVSVRCHKDWMDLWNLMSLGGAGRCHWVALNWAITNIEILSRQNQCNEFSPIFLPLIGQSGSPFLPSVRLTYATFSLLSCQQSFPCKTQKIHVPSFCGTSPSHEHH